MSVDRTGGKGSGASAAEAVPDKVGKPRRTRRPGGEVRGLIVAAARASFQERGYARSTTREIADRAGVAEVLIFRKFGSKANLFAEAALLPMVDLLEAWTKQVEPGTDADAMQQQRQFIEHLYKVAIENRGLLLSLLAAGESEPDVLIQQDAAALFHRSLDALVDASEQRMQRSDIDLTGIDIRVAGRATLGMVLAMALFGDWLLPKDDRRPGHDELLDQLARFSVYGLYPKPSAAAGRKKRGGLS